MSAIVKWAREHPGEVALVDARGSMSWEELDDRLNRGINALLDLGGAGPSRLAVLAENSVETVIAHLCGILAGWSTVPVNSHLNADEVAYILADSGASVLFVDPQTVDTGIEAAGRVATARAVTVVGWRTDGRDGVRDWGAWLAAADPSEPPVDLAPRRHLHYTSGTTGRPKGTETPPGMWPEAATIAEWVEAVAGGLSELQRGRGLLVSPSYHTGPLGSIRSVAGGTSLVVLGRFDAESTLQAIQEWRPTTTLMVPTHFQRLLALPETTRLRYDVSSLRAVFHTGAPCPTDVKRRMIDWFGPVLYEAYGATESGTTNMITSEEWLAHPGSVGRTIPPFVAVVVDDEGRPLGPGTEGRLYFRDETGRGIVYHNDPEKTLAAHLRPGVFTLGEVGYVDGDGFVYITDRFSDMIVTGGVNVYPTEAEQVLLTHPDVADVAGIGVPNDDLGEELKMLVVAERPDQPPAAADLIAFCREHMALYKCPRSIDFVADLGRTAMGKLNKRSLRAPYWPTARTIA